MAIEFCVLASGSKANCLYVTSRETRILIDCGLSTKQVELRLAEIGVEPASLDAIIVSHEHSDHIRGLPVFLKRYRVPVYLNLPTYQSADKLHNLPHELFSFFETGDAFGVRDLDLHSFSVHHDAADPVGFKVVSKTGTALSVVTDLGHVTSLVREQVKGTHAIILESNHCPVLLEDAPYPWSIKQRIAGKSGHLSNQHAGDLLTELSNSLESKLEVVVAAHISENSNCPKRALSVLEDSWKRGERGQEELEFVAASADAPTRLFKISNI